MTKHISVRNKLKQIPKRTTFEELIEEAMLTNTEKQMMKMHYIEGKNLGYIADILGYSEAGIQKMHKRILRKIESLI